MLAALGTLPFLATIWLLLVLGARVLEESGAKIAAALKGDASPEAEAVIVQLRPRAALRISRPVRAQPRWRAAA